MHKPRFSTVVPTQGPFADPGAFRALVAAAEELGFEGAWFGDRVAVPRYAAALTPPNWFDALACCAAAAGATRRLRLGTDVLVAPLRHPVALARFLATADQLSGGRMVAGLGVGYLRGEFAAVARDRYHRRGDVTDEVLEVLRLALAPAPQSPRSFHGRWFTFDELCFGPPPLQDPFPLWAGGNSAAAQRRAATLANGWHPLFPTPEAYQQGRQRIEALLGSPDGFTFSLSCPQTTVVTGHQAGRLDPGHHGGGAAAIPDDFTYAPPPPMDPSGRPRFMGTPEQVAGDVERYLSAGVEHFVLRFFTTQPEMTPTAIIDQLSAFATQVAARFA